ncbi:MAG TPA: hypothetical protein VF651_06315 [Gammaproteobacteria bacterium]
MEQIRIRTTFPIRRVRLAPDWGFERDYCNGICRGSCVFSTCPHQGIHNPSEQLEFDFNSLH